MLIQFEHWHWQLVSIMFSNYNFHYKSRPQLINIFFLSLLFPSLRVRAFNSKWYDCNVRKLHAWKEDHNIIINDLFLKVYHIWVEKFSLVMIATDEIS